MSYVIDSDYKLKSSRHCHYDPVVSSYVCCAASNPDRTSPPCWIVTMFPRDCVGVRICAKLSICTQLILIDLSAFTRSIYYVHRDFFSRHIRSMWEIICDAWACWSGWNFGPNSTEYPYSEIQFQNTPHPPKMKIVRDLGTSTFQFQNPPLPWKWKLSEILALWLFSFRIPPPPENEKCQRSWHFDFSVSDYTPPLPPPHTHSPPRKLTFRQILAL